MQMIPAALHRAVLRIVHPLARAVWRVTRPSVSGAYVLITRDRDTPDEAWLLVANTYKSGLTLPGGGIAPDESPRAAARRETIEEVGLDFDESRFTPRDDFEIEYLHRLDHVHFFEVELEADEAVSPRADGREIAWAEFRRRDDVPVGELTPPVRRYLDRLAGRG